MRLFMTLVFVIQLSISVSGNILGDYYCDEIIRTAIADTVILKDTTIVIDSALIRDTSFTKTSMVVDSTKQAVQVDTLKPIQYLGYSYSNKFVDVITKEEINKLDYRYTGNILPDLSFAYTKDLGWYGQPNETTLFGLGFDNISYTVDGISENNRINNSLDLNFIQSEYLDSLEFVPLPLGFLYNSFNNPITVNFITRDKIAARPYTRIRFYQALKEEGYIDAIFNAYLMSRLNFTFEFTNGTVDPLYANSNSSKWQIAAKLRYMPYNWLNIIAGYSHVKSETHLNGGVDLSWVTASTTQDEIDNFLYDPLSDNVIYKDRYQKTARHNFNLKLLGRIIKGSPSDLTFYYQTNLTEFRQNEKGNYSELPAIFDNNEYNILGMTARQILDLEFVKFDFKADYEKIKYNADILEINESRDLFSLGGRAQFSFLNDNLNPSFFVKSLHYAGNIYPGFGADMILNLSDNLNLYTGFSNYKRPLSMMVEQYVDESLSIDSQSITAAQAGLRFRIDNLNGALSIFSFRNNNSLVPVIDHYSPSLLINEVGYYITESTNNMGINLKLDYNLWKILLSNNVSYYVMDNGDRNYSVPEFTIRGGIYYIDTLFNDNLKLKAGLSYNFSGIQDYSVYDFEKSVSANYYIEQGMNAPLIINGNKISPSFQIDLFVAGKIQDAAIVYIVFENLLNREYYLVPNYPMFGPALRLGVAWEFLD